VRAKRVFISAGLLAVVGLSATGTAIWVQTAWVSRHDPSLQELRELSSQLEIAVRRIEDDRQANGRYPSSRSDDGMSENMWYYDVDPAGDSYELYVSHSHWISSFNALLYASSGTPRPRWEGLRMIRYGTYHYYIGAQNVGKDW
jgi:hypothetical protein